MSPLVKLPFARIPKEGWAGEEGGGYKVRGKSEGAGDKVPMGKIRTRYLFSSTTTNAPAASRGAEISIPILATGSYR